VDRVIVSVEIEDIGSKRVDARRNVLVQSLIDEVRIRFGLREGDYAMFLKGHEEPLDPERTLAQHGLRDGAELSVAKKASADASKTSAIIQQGEQRPVHGYHQAYLEEERRAIVFPLNWQPAVIGRPYRFDPSKNKLLAVDLTGIDGSEHVSRHHACILETEGQYSVESLSPRNPTYINNQGLSPGKPHVLQPGDRIRVGRVVLIFNLRG